MDACGGSKTDLNPCFDRITEAMQAPSFYPQPVDKVQMAETHISMIFLTGVKVYKVKKPLKLDFLDFSTLDQRRRYCHDEVRLNRRLSADVYLGVSAVTAEEDGFALDGPGTVVEYAVCMRQLPRDRTLEQLLPAGGIASGALDLLARRLVSFYQDSATGGAIDAMGTTEAIAGNCLENLEQTAPFTGRLLAPDSHEQVHVATESFLRQHRHRFAKRIRAARIREGHGDLRPDHVYFTEMGIQIIDCIEFNERFRYLDTVCDLAFLLMEIDRMGYPWAADTLLRAYLEHADDLQAFHLVTFYKCYRAMVRVKVNCLRLDQKDLGPAEHDALVAQTEAYLSLARDYTEIFNRPAVFVVCGVIATGKSTLADALADTLDLEHFHSDRIRQTMVSSNGPPAIGGRQVCAGNHRSSIRKIAPSCPTGAHPEPICDSRRHLWQPSQT